MRRIGKLLVVLVALVLGASACGDDGGGGASPLGGGGDGGDDTSALEDVGDADSIDDIIEDAVDTAEDFLDGAPSEGGASITVDGVTYTSSDPQFCVFQGDEVLFEGLAEGSDGTSGWLVIGRSVETREELLEFFDEAIVDNMVDENGISETAGVALDVGRTELVASVPDDQPAFDASVNSGFGQADFTFDHDGNRMSGEGEIADFNAVAVEFGSKLPFSFEVSCG